MSQLLSVQRISLVRVVSNELTVVLPARKKKVSTTITKRLGTCQAELTKDMAPKSASPR
jgi:hypothetical protein